MERDYSKDEYYHRLLHKEMPELLASNICFHTYSDSGETIRPVCTNEHAINFVLLTVYKCVFEKLTLHLLLFAFVGQRFNL